MRKGNYKVLQESCIDTSSSHPNPKDRYNFMFKNTTALKFNWNKSQHTQHVLAAPDYHNMILVSVLIGSIAN